MPEAFLLSTSPTSVPQGGQPFDRAPMRPFFLSTKLKPSLTGSIPCDTAVSTWDGRDARIGAEMRKPGWVMRQVRGNIVIMMIKITMDSHHLISFPDTI